MADPELWGCAIFGPVPVSVCPKQNYFGKLILFPSTY